MRIQSLLRDAAMLSAAVVVGWWARGGAVHAAPTAPLALGYQFQSSGESNLTLYDPATRTVYVYPTHSGDSNIGCSQAFVISDPGASITRVNCKPASLTEH